MHRHSSQLALLPFSAPHATVHPSATAPLSAKPFSRLLTFAAIRSPTDDHPGARAPAPRDSLAPGSLSPPAPHARPF